MISRLNKKAVLLFLFAAVACKSRPEETKSVKVELPEEARPKEQAGPGLLERSLIEQGLIDIQSVDSTILVDLKYSTTDNFFGADVYNDLTRAYLPPDVSEKLRRAHDFLKEANPNYRFMVFDGVRPHGVQQILWRTLDSIPPLNRKAYVADPAEGSLHNYGCAVDLSVFDLVADTLLDMGTQYDYFGDLAYPRKEQWLLQQGLLSQIQIENRQVLRSAMQRAGFTAITSEWWHFNSTSLANAKTRYKRID